MTDHTQHREVRRLTMDRLTPERRSWNMSRVGSRDTQPERKVRSILHRMGYRFSLRRDDLPGKPDIVLPKHKTIVFVHGCFWHQHPGCVKATIPKTRTRFWQEKLMSNVRRDKKVAEELRTQGWRVITVWECDAKGDHERLARRLDRALATHQQTRKSGN